MKRINPARKSYNQEHSTLQEIAEAMHLTRERVRQIEAKAIIRIREKFKLLNIKERDLLDL